MKLRKTRIAKITKANGDVQFSPEFKSKEGSFTHTEQETKDAIDFYIARVKYYNARDIENTVVKTEYQRYP